MLKVKLLHPDATVPTVTNPGEDLGYDLYALEDTVLLPLSVVKVKTGISAVYEQGMPSWSGPGPKYGLLLRDRSSMAARGITVSAGVVDAGYRGEIVVLLTSVRVEHIQKGDKIAQMMPFPVRTANGATVVDELPVSVRGEKGFGSSGK